MLLIVETRGALVAPSKVPIALADPYARAGTTCILNHSSVTLALTIQTYGMLLTFVPSIRLWLETTLYLNVEFVDSICCGPQNCRSVAFLLNMPPLLGRT